MGSALLRSPDGHSPSAGVLLFGEDPDSVVVADAVHWITVYLELLKVKSALLERARLLSDGVQDAAMEEAGIDTELLEAQVNGCQGRLEYWTQRARQLSYMRGDGFPQRLTGRGD